jgi:hypothetical protein
MPHTLKITFLQILYITLETTNAAEVLHDNQSLIQFINYSILSINEDYKDSSHNLSICKLYNEVLNLNLIVEEQLILLIVYKCVQKEPRIIPLMTA